MKLKKTSLIEGTIFAYLAIILIKVLGAVYVIPFHDIIGDEGWILYGYAYTVYIFFQNISTSGIPTAVSILIAEYNRTFEIIENIGERLGIKILLFKKCEWKNGNA